MDRLDTTLKRFFTPEAPPALARRMVARLAPPPDLSGLIARFAIEASDRGVQRLAYGRGRDLATRAGRRHLERAREELQEYLAGRRTFFTVPMDLEVPPFQAKVLAAADRVPFGEVTSYAELARRIGHPRAARAVGNALGANPVPIFLPCHRIVRGDGTWGHYAFGGALKTRLLALERATPALVGSATTRIVCRHGCAHEQRIAEPNRIVFASVADAASVGYRPCRRCRPVA
ncbi:MAG TPA: methylated-DNA--[protein]-cysteine S-methyltransferase [Methylomirabilota bacterium]|jgi:methylated-DNA-[protein]-cysteine S-methyltransferase